MDAQNEAVALLSLATRKGLIAQQSAATIKVQIESGVHQPGAKPVAELLVKEGHITAPQAELLLNEFAKAQGPKIIGGHQLVSKLGQGGMGAVFKAIQLSMQREVALKLLNPALAKDKEFVERFVREARAAGKVVHANVISCYDVGVDNGTPFMSLELVSGGDALRKVQAAGGHLPEREAVGIIRDAAMGLSAIHRAGLIHRDIKPANIFLTEDGHAKLADLGLARSTSGDDRMTQTGAAVGSPAYMSPEQAKGAHDLDIRTDIYSLGASLYHLLVGTPPFSASSVFATVAKVINEPVPDPRAANPSISPAASALIKKSMSKDRNQRQQTPEELIADLEAVLAGKHPAGRSAPMPAQAHRPGHAHGHARPARSAEPRLQNGMGLYIGLGVAAVVVLILAVTLMGGKKTPPPADPPRVASAPTTPAPATSAPVVPSATESKPAASTVAPPPAQPVRGLIRDAVRDRIADRIEAAPAATPLVQPSPVTPPPPVQPAQPVPPTQAAQAAEAPPAWADQAGPLLDAIYAANFDQAVETAKALPREYQDAVAKLQQARVDLPKVYQSHVGSIVSAKPTLKAMPNIPDVAVQGATAKGFQVRNPQGMGTTVFYDKLTAEDHATLREVLAQVSMEPWQSRTLMHLGLTSDEAVAKADAKDPSVASLQRLVDLRREQAAEAKRVKEAEQRAKAALTGINTAQLSERTQSTIRNITEITTFAPVVISGTIDRPVELRDFVFIRADTVLAPGGRLIPTAGALVVNGADRVTYEPVEVRGLPFVSMSLSPYQTTCVGGFDRGATMANAIFYGRALLDGMESPRFFGCTFIGGIGDQPNPNRIAVNGPMQRPGQMQSCDFFRVKFQGNLAVANSDRCWFGACDMEVGPISGRPMMVPGWNPDGSLVGVLARAAALPIPRIDLMPAPGRPVTPFGNDTPALARFLDATAANAVERIKDALAGR